MDFRIDVSTVGDRLRLKLAGDFSAPHPALVERLCREAPGRVVVDLTDLITADSEGIQVLLSLRELGVALTGVSPYYAFRLEGSPAPARPGSDDLETSGPLPIADTEEDS